MVTYNADCTTCALGGGEHTQAVHNQSIKWTQTLARELDLGRKAPADNGRTRRYGSRVPMFGGV